MCLLGERGKISLHDESWLEQLHSEQYSLEQMVTYASSDCMFV